MDRGTEHLDVIFFENSALVKFDSAVEGCLASESKQDTLGTLPCYDLLDKKRSDRQEVDPVGTAFACLDGGDIRIDEDGLDTFLPHRLEGL